MGDWRLSSDDGRPGQLRCGRDEEQNVLVYLSDHLIEPAWDVPLEPRDSRWPPAELKLQAALAELLESDPPEPIPKAMPKRPEAKPMPNPAATPGESSSTGATPKAKARPELKLLLIGLSRDLLKATCYVSLPIRITGILCLQHPCG